MKVFEVHPHKAVPEATLEQFLNRQVTLKKREVFAVLYNPEEQRHEVITVKDVPDEVDEDPAPQPETTTA